MLYSCTLMATVGVKGLMIDDVAGGVGRKYNIQLAEDVAFTVDQSMRYAWPCDPSLKGPLSSVTACLSGCRQAILNRPKQESLANAKVSTRQQCVYEGP